MTDPRQVAVHDQFEAAAKDATATLNRVGAHMGRPPATNVNPLHWVDRSPYHAALVRWWRPDGSLLLRPGCKHIGRTVRPVGGLLVRPPIIYCLEQQCLVREAIKLAEVEPDRCDACLQPAAGGWFREMMANVGPVLVGGNICDRCADIVDRIERGR